MIEGTNIEYTCEKCNETFSVVYTSWQPTIVHVKCGGTARMKILADEEGKKSKIAIKTKTDVTGFGYDNKGQLVGISKKGKRVKPSETIYDLKKDKYGWESTGHKVKGKQKR